MIIDQLLGLLNVALNRGGHCIFSSPLLSYRRGHYQGRLVCSPKGEKDLRTYARGILQLPISWKECTKQLVKKTIFPMREGKIRKMHQLQSLFYEGLESLSFQGIDLVSNVGQFMKCLSASDFYEGRFPLL
jgi:hypothetical protein